MSHKNERALNPSQRVLLSPVQFGFAGRSRCDAMVSKSLLNQSEAKRASLCSSGSCLNLGCWLDAPSIPNKNSWKELIPPAGSCFRNFILALKSEKELSDSMPASVVPLTFVADEFSGLHLCMVCSSQTFLSDAISRCLKV